MAHKGAGGKIDFLANRPLLTQQHITQKQEEIDYDEILSATDEHPAFYRPHQPVLLAYLPFCYLVVPGSVSIQPREYSEDALKDLQRIEQLFIFNQKIQACKNLESYRRQIQSALNQLNTVNPMLGKHFAELVTYGGVSQTTFLFAAVNEIESLVVKEGFRIKGTEGLTNQLKIEYGHNGIDIHYARNIVMVEDITADDGDILGTIERKILVNLSLTLKLQSSLPEPGIALFICNPDDRDNGDKRQFFTCSNVKCHIEGEDIKFLEQLNSWVQQKPWQPDNEVRGCNLCRRSFSILKRKHHCRMCGKIFCGQCMLRKDLKAFPELTNMPCRKASMEKALLCRPCASKAS